MIEISYSCLNSKLPELFRRVFGWLLKCRFPCTEHSCSVTAKLNSDPKSQKSARAQLHIDWMKIIRWRVEASAVVSRASLFLNFKSTSQQISTGNYSRVCVETTQPHNTFLYQMFPTCANLFFIGSLTRCVLCGRIYYARTLRLHSADLNPSSFFTCSILCFYVSVLLLWLLMCRCARNISYIVTWMRCPRPQSGGGGGCGAAALPKDRTEQSGTVWQIIGHRVQWNQQKQNHIKKRIQKEHCIGYTREW
jgi:hypothetical protein